MKASTCINVVIATTVCIFFQASPSHSFFQSGGNAVTDGEASPMVQQAGQENPGSFFQGFMKPGAQGQGHHGHGKMGWGKHIMGQLNGLNLNGFNLQGLSGLNLGQNVMQQFAPHLQNIHNQANKLQQHVYLLKAHTPKTFYRECGKSERQCQWAAKVNPVQQQVADAEEAQAAIKTEYAQQCTLTKHTCVGNTETCVSDGSCDVAMKITETVVEGSKKGSHLQVSYINNCKLGGQSATDQSRMPQMYFGIGFATFNEAGDRIECRRPEVKDFKMIFLWKNSTVESSDSPKICEKAKDDDFFAVTAMNMHLQSSMRSWHNICKTMDLAKEESFNLKTFMQTRVATSHATSFFSPPFDFADNFQAQSSSNGMALTGSVQ